MIELSEASSVAPFYLARAALEASRSQGSFAAYVRANDKAALVAAVLPAMLLLASGVTMLKKRP